MSEQRCASRWRLVTGYCPLFEVRAACQPPLDHIAFGLFGDTFSRHVPYQTGVIWNQTHRRFVHG